MFAFVLVLAITSCGFVTSDAPYDIENHPNFARLPHDQCGDSMSDRIIGGENARLGQYPWLARIGYSLNNCPESQKKPIFTCGGSLINERFVVTAAHCVYLTPIQLCRQTGKNETMMLTHVVLGEHVVGTNIDCEQGVCADPTQNFGVVDIVYHAMYNNPPLKWDIAVIKLHKNAVYTGWVAPICVPRGIMLHKSYIGQSAEVAGWGINNVREQTISKTLLFVTVPIINNKFCIAAFKDYSTITNSEICAGGVRGKDSCGGDSGGPLMIVSADLGRPRYYMLGVVSFGSTECGATPTPAVYSNVPYFLKWILDNMEY